MVTEVVVGESAGQQPEHAEGCEQGLDSRIGEAYPGHALTGVGDDGLGEGGQGGGSVGGVVAESLDVEQTSVG